MTLIEEWKTDHPHLHELNELIEQLNQTAWMIFTVDWHLSSHLLVALNFGRVSGFLRYVAQPIGPDENLPPFTYNGEALLEAKVIAFGVAPDRRRQGIGRSLQLNLIHACRSKGLFQIRSHSSTKNIENHALKTSLEFGIHPLNPEKGRDGYYFILPLRSSPLDELIDDNWKLSE